MKYIHQRLFTFSLIILTIMITASNVETFRQEQKEFEELEKVEHQVDTMTCIQGTYKGEGIIETIDNRWKCLADCARWFKYSYKCRSKCNFSDK